MYFGRWPPHTHFPFGPHGILTPPAHVCSHPYPKYPSSHWQLPNASHCQPKTIINQNQYTYDKHNTIINIQCRGQNKTCLQLSCQRTPTNTRSRSSQADTSRWRRSGLWCTRCDWRRPTWADTCRDTRCRSQRRSNPHCTNTGRWRSRHSTAQSTPSAATCSSRSAPLCCATATQTTGTMISTAFPTTARSLQFQNMSSFSSWFVHLQRCQCGINARRTSCIRNSDFLTTFISINLFDICRQKKNM